MAPKVAARDVDISDLADDLLNSELELEQPPAQPVINRTVVKKTTTKARAGTAKPAATKKAAAPKTATTKSAKEATAATKSASKEATAVTKSTSTATAAAAAKAKAQREALKDRTNMANGSDTEEVDEFDENTEAALVKPKAKRSRTTKAKEDDPIEEAAPAKKAARTTKAKAAPAVPACAPAPAAGAGAKDEIPDSQAPTKSRKPKTVKRAPSPERIESIPETQAEPEEAQDISHTIEEPEDDMDIDDEPPRPAKAVAVPRARSTSQQRHAPAPVYPARARSTSMQPRNFSRSRAGSASDTERRMAESEAKKKLQEMTRKYEDMRMKYDSLQELAQNASESNFDKLKKASDERAKDANNLISSLKREIAELRKASSSSTSESARLTSALATLTSTYERTVEEAKANSTLLHEAQNEVKALTAKLDAARKANQAPVVEKVPSSTAKSQLARSQIGGSGPEATKHAAMKEELYRDLTGLIINSVKRKEGEDEYSCIQTGRNGTLHFHLTITNDSNMANPKTPSGLSYEEAEFAYEPVLDENRDRDLVDILPDYLTEDICFPRAHAVKFYTKVVESMTRRIQVDEEE